MRTGCAVGLGAGIWRPARRTAARPAAMPLSVIYGTLHSVVYAYTLRGEAPLFRGWASPRGNGMPTKPPELEIESEHDAILATHHVANLSFNQQRAAAACALLVPDSYLATHLFLTLGAVRVQISRTEHRALDLLPVPRNRTMLGRWCVFHWECCTTEAARRCEDGTLFDPAGD